MGASGALWSDACGLGRRAAGIGDRAGVDIEQVEYIGYGNVALRKGGEGAVRLEGWTVNYERLWMNYDDVTDTYTCSSIGDSDATRLRWKGT